MEPNIEVNLEFTPNPDTLKYSVNRTLVASGVANYTEAKLATGKSPLAEELFKIPDVLAVMFGKNFLTITLAKQDQLQDIHPRVVETVRSYLESGKPIVTAQEVKPATPLSEIEKKICEILDTEIKPAVAMDGGDISFEKFEDGFVYLRMQGSCAGCPSSMMTLKMGVENRLREAIPEVQEVIPV